MHGKRQIYLSSQRIHFNLKIGRREPLSFPVEYFKRCLQFLVSIWGFFVGNLNGFKFCMGTQ